MNCIWVLLHFDTYSLNDEVAYLVEEGELCFRQRRQNEQRQQGEKTDVFWGHKRIIIAAV